MVVRPLTAKVLLNNLWAVYMSLLQALTFALLTNRIGTEPAVSVAIAANILSDHPLWLHA